MKNIIDTINDHLDAIPTGKGEMGIETKDGEFYPLLELVGKDVGKMFPNGIVTTRSPEKAIETALNSLLDTTNITPTVYQFYVDTMTKFNKLVMGNMTSQTRNYLRNVSKEVAYELELVPLKSRKNLKKS